jgi:hypothetical protein
MIKLSRSLLPSILTAFAVVTTTSEMASARTGYDGVWSVIVHADAGPCSGAYRYPIAIVNGSVRHVDPNDQMFDVYGRVASRGQVRVTVSRGDQRATGVGRLSRAGGGGTWRSPNGCGGRWEAERRS